MCLMIIQKGGDFMKEWKKPEIVAELILDELISEEGLGDWSREWPRKWTRKD